MNIIWICIISFSLILLIFTQPNLVMISFLDGSSKAIELIIKLWAIYAFWMGILKIIEDTKLNLKINKLLKKPINFIFGNISNEAKNHISTNISCNMLGMGNASIPSGIKAMEILSANKRIATSPIIAFIILNTCNLQVFPTTIISLLAIEGCSSPTKIILPTLIVSIICLSIGIGLLKLLSKFLKDKT